MDTGYRYMESLLSNRGYLNSCSSTSKEKSSARHHMIQAFQKGQCMLDKLMSSMPLLSLEVKRIRRCPICGWQRWKQISDPVNIGSWFSHLAEHWPWRPKHLVVPFAASSLAQQNVEIPARRRTRRVSGAGCPAEGLPKTLD